MERHIEKCKRNILTFLIVQKKIVSEHRKYGRASFQSTSALAEHQHEICQQISFGITNLQTNL